MSEQPTVGSRRAPLALLAITLAAAWLRLFHLDVGLPGTTYVDAFKFVDEAARMATTGDFAPRDFQYPGFYANLLAILYALGGATSAYARHLAALVVTALAGVALVPVTHALARRVTGAHGALVAAALAAACPVLLNQSRTPAPDIVMALFATAALALILAPEPSWRRLLAAGALAGLAAGCKFNGGYAVPWIAAAGWLIEPRGGLRRGWRRALVVLAVAGASFLVTTPWFLPRLASYAGRLELEMRMQSYGQIGRIQLSRLDYLFSRTPTWEQPWVGSSLLGALGPVVMVVALAALGWGLLGRGGRRVVFLAAYVLLYGVMVSGAGHVRAMRFLLPALPVLYVLMGSFLEAVMVRRLAASRLSRASVGILATGLVMLLLAVPITTSVRFAWSTRLPLTNDLAEAWAEKSIPPGTRVALAPFYADNLERLPLDFVYMDSPGSRQYRIPEGLGPSPERRPLYYPTMVDELRGAGVEYLVLNSYFDGSLSPIPENLEYFPKSVAAREAFMKRLTSEAELAYSVKGQAEGRLGPDIDIYRMRRASD